MIDTTKTTTTRGKEEEEKKERIDDETINDDDDEAKMMTIKEVVRDACEEGGYTLRRNSSLGVNECTTTETTKGGRGEGGSSYGVSLEEQILILSTSSSEIKFDVDDFLRRLVHEVKEYARPPTSNFHVGAACLTNRGNIFLGVNVEVEKCALNRSVHAEQCMITNAMVGIRNAELEEYRRKEKMKGGKKTKEEREKERRKEHESNNNNNNNESNEEEEKEKIVKIAITHAPCGHCRQFMNELRDAKDIQILLPGMAAMRLEELLPKAFGPLDLEVPGDEEHREERIKRRKSEGSDAIVVDEEKVHVRTLLLDGCPPNPRDRDGLGTMEKFCKLLREALEDGRIRFGQFSFGNLEEEERIFAAMEELAHTMAHSYAPYTDSPCAIAIPLEYQRSLEERWKTGDKRSGMRFYFGASVECAAYNPSMTPMHAMQVALHCTPFRPSSYKKSSPEYGHIGTRPLFWSQRRCPISIYVFGFRDAKISYAETLKKEFEDIARRCDTDYAPQFIVKEILFDRHMFSVEDPHAVIVREYERIRSMFVEVLDWYSL
jgi:cytidine deaminase